MKTVLIGDSIRMGYLPFVTRRLEGVCSVWGPDQNGRHSLWALDHFPDWVAAQEPNVVHVNFGIHDVSVMPDGQSQIILEQYRLCLRRFIAKTKELEGVSMIWASSTPLYCRQEDVPMAEWTKRTDIEEYNAAALEIATDEGLAVNDLHQAILDHDFTKCLREDGCHMTEFGNEVLSEAVAAAVRAAL